MKKEEKKKESLTLSEIKNSREIQSIIKMQEDFLVNNYADKDRLVADNKRLNEEIARLNRTIMLDNNYINYLLNSSWWKLTLPLRKLSRKRKSKKTVNTYNFLEDLPLPDTTTPISEKVSVVIFTYNAGDCFSSQLDNIIKQKFINDIEIVIIDRGSNDNTLNIAKKYNATIVKVNDITVSDDEMYIRCLPKITGNYVVIMDQNKIVDSKYWIYQSIRPIRDEQAVSSVFFRENVDNIAQTDYYYDLKCRMKKIAGEPVLFFPQNRDIVQYLSPVLLDKSCILVKKNVANMFLI